MGELCGDCRAFLSDSVTLEKLENCPGKWYADAPNGETTVECGLDAGVIILNAVPVRRVTGGHLEYRHETVRIRNPYLEEAQPPQIT